MRKLILTLAIFAVAIPVAGAQDRAGSNESDPPRAQSSSSVPRATDAGEGTNATGEMNLEINAGTTSSEEKGGKIEHEWKVEEGESTPGIEPDDIDANTEQEAQVDYFLKIDGVDGESKDDKKKSSAAAEMEEAMDVMAESDPEPVMPDFSILLGGGSQTKEAQEARDNAAKLLLTEIQENTESGERPMETLSLNFEKIKMKYEKSEVKLFGFIPVQAAATVEIDAENTVKVKFPWWAFLASGKDADEIKTQSITHLGAALIELRNSLKAALMVK